MTDLVWKGLMSVWPTLQVDSAGFTAALGAANRLNQGVSVASAWGFETILTCLLVFTVFAATDARRAKETAHLPVSPVARGNIVILNCSCSQVTRCSCA